MKIEAPNYTQTPNDLFDRWLPHLSEGELKVLLVIMRKTFGWHKKRDRISITQLSEITGLLRETVIKATKSLQSKGIIIKDVKGQAGKQETYYELVVEEDSNNSYPSVKPTPLVGLNPLGSTDPQKKASLKETNQKKQQQASPAPCSAAASFYQELKDIDIPLSDKIEITKTYPIENVKHALLWLAKNERPLTKGAAAALKWAARYLPEIPQPKKVEKPPVDAAPYNKTYYRDLNTIAARNGIRLYDQGLREGTSEYLETENDRIYFKDVSFLEQLANYLRKKSIVCRNIFETIKVCQSDLVKQLC